MSFCICIKICGLICEEDVCVIVVVGVDVLGLVFYFNSLCYVMLQCVGELVCVVLFFVSIVGLFVNLILEEVQQVLVEVFLMVLQFYGDEMFEQCVVIVEVVVRFFICVVRIGSLMQFVDLLEYEQVYCFVSLFFIGLLFDILVEEYGGSGKVFDWFFILKEFVFWVVLSGGLSVYNVIEVVVGVCFYVVDISSGVEVVKGIKDVVRIEVFIQVVCLVDVIFVQYIF